MPFTTIFTYVYHQHAQIFCHNIHKNSSHLWKHDNLATWLYQRDRMVHTREPETAPHEIFLSHLNMHRRTNIIQRPIKRLKPSHVSWFDLLPSDFLADIDICLSRLEHRNKSKHVILHFKSMCNPVLFEISYKLWTPYHDFGALCCYNQ